MLRGKRREGCACRRRWTISCGLLTLAATLGIPTSAGAQAPPPPPPPPPTREEVTRPEPRPEPRPPARLEVQGGIERAPCFLESPEYAGIKFTLRDVVFDGLQGISSDALRSAAAPLIGREQPVSVICEIRDRAATELRQAGYVASVEVPEQRIADGTVHFRVLMAKLVQVRVRGNASRRRAGDRRPISKKLTEQPVFNRFDAERYLLLASDIPGYNVRLTLRPAGTVPGEVIGDVTVVRTPAYVDANIQDYGSKALGPLGRIAARAIVRPDRARRPDHAGGVLDLRPQGAADGPGRARLPPGLRRADDRRQLHLFLGAAGHRRRQRLPLADAACDARGRVSVRSPPVAHGARRGRASTSINQDVELNDIDLTRDRLRVAFARVTADAAARDVRGYTLVEPHWRLSGLLELRRGLDFLGATDSCGPAGADCLGAGRCPAEPDRGPTAPRR